MARTVRSPRDPGRPVRRRGAGPRGAGGGRGDRRVRALLEAAPHDRPLHVVYDSTYAQKCVTTWVHSWSRGGRVPPERWVTKEGTAVKNADLVARIAGLLAGRTVTWSKVKSHTTLTTTAHLLNREADLRAGAVVEALAAGRPWEAGPGWAGWAG